jgi:glycerol-3-phosphate dehydrogenase
LQTEIDFILKHIGRYLSKDPQLDDVKSMFAGLRPLVKGKNKKTASLSRDHSITIGASGLITITGGKWTTYRKMAEEVIDIASETAGLNANPSITKDLLLYGHDQPVPPASISSLEKNDLALFIQSAVENEMCLTVEDFLSRRSRQLVLDTSAAIEAAPFVAETMASRLGKDNEWIKQQLAVFNSIAKNYLPSS